LGVRGGKLEAWNILAIFKWRSVKLDETTARILSAVPRGRSDPPENLVNSGQGKEQAHD
jgi:hypothetical protein